MNRSVAEPAAAVKDMITAGHRARMIQVAARIGLADMIASGRPTTARLAALTATDSGSLARLLRALEVGGLLTQTANGAWELTDLGGTLRSDSPAACHAAALYWGLDCVRAAWDRLEHSLRTGSSAFSRANGVQFFEHMRTQPVDGEIFDAFMTANQRERAALHAEAIDCRNIQHFVDVGGGEGAFAIELLKRNPHIRGGLLELPNVAAKAREKVAREQLQDRMAIVEGSFFDGVPGGADAYVLSAVLHDWPDEQAVAILRACRAAMRPDARLVVIEQVIESAGTATQFSAELDIAMLVLLGGKERSREEFTSLLAAAELSICEITPTPTTFSIIIARPADRAA